MELTNEFKVGVPIAQAWAVLTDVERIAPCLPGAELQEIEGEEYRGVVKVKVGPITAQYKGKATFVEKDDTSHRAVLRAEGRDTRGQGNANATITATLEADGDGTQVRVVTDLSVTGRVAQFGRGVLADVSAKLLGQFVTCLEADVLGAGAVSPFDQDSSGTNLSGNGPAAVATPVAEDPTVLADVEPVPETEPLVRRIESRPAEPVDLLEAAGGSVARRAVPVVAVVMVLWLFRRRRRRRRRERDL